MPQLKKYVLSSINKALIKYVLIAFEKFIIQNVL